LPASAKLLRQELDGPAQMSILRSGASRVGHINLAGQSFCSERR
jgi:hypothetical protein